MYSARDLHKGGVSPFGHPRINDRSHLPAAVRSVPRPSSPLGAKASTERPSVTQLFRRPHAGPTRQDQNLSAPARHAQSPRVQPDGSNTEYALYFSPPSAPPSTAKSSTRQKPQESLSTHQTFFTCQRSRAITTPRVTPARGIVSMGVALHDTRASWKRQTRRRQAAAGSG